MDLIETIRTRHSVRAFLDDPISREILEKIVADASCAPSAINMQPWEIHVVLGDERKRLSRRLLKSLREKALTCGPGSAKPLSDKFMRRSRDCADQMAPLIREMGMDFKAFVNEGSLNFYGAPAVILIFLDECFPTERMIDIGSFLGYLVLATAAHGLASCPIGLVKSYEDEIKDQLNILESKNLAVSVAIGKPDVKAAINRFSSTRADLKEFVRWIE